MPCFLVGIGAAQMLAQALGVPLRRFSHQQGHIAAALYSAHRLDLLHERFLAFHMSGGTTEAADIYLAAIEEAIRCVEIVSKSENPDAPL